MIQNISIDLIAAAKQSADTPREYTHDRLESAVERYKKFLSLAYKYGEEPLVPTKEIDMIWHLHMLHPQAYFNDCMAFFGYILDHKATSGAAEDEQAAQFASLKATSVLWKQEYGEDYMADASSCMAEAASCMADTKCQTRSHELGSLTSAAGVETVAC